MNDVTTQKQTRLHFVDKQHFLLFLVFLFQNWQDIMAPTFEVNGHGASV